MTLKELFSACPELGYRGQIPDVRIAGLECDSRKVRKDYLFVAVRGAREDGAAFIEDAVKRGAAAVVTEAERKAKVPVIVVPESREAVARLASAYYGRPAERLKVVGITGTNGKTTCAYLIEHFLKNARRKTGVIGTVNYRFAGLEFPASETTPGPLRTQQLLSQMLDAGCEVAVMEVSSHALDQGRVAGIDFEAALFTNLTQDHLDYHGTIEAYFDCKSRLFSGLGAKKTAVLNADDAYFSKLSKKTKANVLSYGIDSKAADLRATKIQWMPDGTRFDCSYKGKRALIRTSLIGRHNVYNVLGAIGTATVLGTAFKECVAAAESFEGVPGRLESVRRGQNFGVYIDFAHTPDGLENVLTALASYRKNKLITVFGCGGDRDRGKRPQMGRIAAQRSDVVIVTSDNPRSEDPRAIASEICAGFPAGFKNFAVTLDRRKAIRQALLAARPGDIVLLAGKGHERTQVVGAESTPFSDREEAERVLDGR